MQNVDASTDSLNRETAPKIPGSWPQSNERQRQNLSNGSQPAFMRDAFVKHLSAPQVTQVGLLSAQRSLLSQPMSRARILKDASPPEPEPSLTRTFSLLRRKASEFLGLRKGDEIRLQKLDGIVSLLEADHIEWIEKPKNDKSTEIFIIRCRNHLKKLERIEFEQDYIRGRDIGVDGDFQESDIYRKMTKGRNLIADYIAEALVVTDESLRREILVQIKNISNFSVSPHRQAALHHAEILASTIEGFDYLTEHSKIELRALLAEVQVKLHGH